MDDVLSKMSTLQITHNWKSKINEDIKLLASYYANELYENICFIPFETFDNESKLLLIDFLVHNNHARTLLSEQIKTIYPNLQINTSDVDSIMDYYLNSLLLV